MASVKITRLYTSGRLLNSAMAKQSMLFSRNTSQLVYNRQPNVQSITGGFSPSTVRTLSTSSAYHQQLPHFKKGQDPSATIEDRSYLLPHPIWTEEDVNKVEVTHQPPSTKIDKAAYYSVQLLRTTFDLASLYKIGPMTENKWLNRIIMLETVAGVPGMIGGMARHLKSLRRLSRDHGWIHTLLEEAENERMHLMTALELKKPGMLFRGVIMAAQGVFVNMFFIAYMLSPRFCHRFVGYLEEEAVKTYTYCIECIDNGKLPEWRHLQAPQIASEYWRLKKDATMRDVVLAIRADEAHHRVVNHTLGSLDLNDPNPFHPGQRKL